jgi:predicted PurR-regulated permease PerM
MEEGSKPPPVRLEIAWKTILKVLAGVLLAFIVIKLWPLCKLLIVSILLAVPMYRLAAWAWRKGWPRWAGLLLASLTLVFSVIGVAALVGPMVINQASNLGQNLPKLKQQLMQKMEAGPLRRAVDEAGSFSSDDAIKRISQEALSAAKATMGAAVDVMLVIALAIYMMIDGPRALQWMVIYFPVAQRARVSKGLEKIGDRVVAFIIGQSILSALFAAYVLTVLSILHVPMALLLAVVAGLLDVVPVLGIATSLVLGGVMGMTVSATTALLVVVFYGAYHILENYLILPKVYGKKLRLSTLAVLLSMIAGGMVAGVIGAIGILPLVAAYPALESLWLAPELEPKVIKDHQEQLRAA